MASLFQTECAGCHSGDTPDGNYSVTGYVSAIGPGSDDIANAIIGDASSELLVRLATTDPTDPHNGMTQALEVATQWIVDCRVSWSETGPHAPGILNPADDQEFHGVRLTEVSFELNVCGNCHGVDFTGGVGGSCFTCHPVGNAGCLSCHDSPITGAHPSHLGATTLVDSFGCVACHGFAENAWHAYNPDGTIVGPRVNLGALASQGLVDGGEWDNVNGTCLTYCHGDAFNDANAMPVNMSWWSTAAVGCTTCHGQAPSGHGDVGGRDCDACHERSVPGAPDWRLKHVDGTPSVGDESGGCHACHGSGASFGAPPPDLAGSSDPTTRTVGAHAAHIDTPIGAHPGYDCTVCHLTPDVVFEAGHVDTAAPAEVFPVAAGFTSVATADGVVASWDGAGGTCTNYCHGLGPALADDTAATLNRFPVWTAGSGQVNCSSCHGFPPETPSHPARVDCTTCHGLVVDGNGAIIIDAVTSATQTTITTLHIDGTLDF